jgi:glycosyltransferase involved in cell wall biosynthesis
LFYSTNLEFLNIKNFFQSFLLKRICTKHDLLLVMDERVYAKPAIHKKYNLAFLPEPWEGEFGKISKNDSRNMVGLPKDEFLFLLIGKQNKRKGLVELLKAIKYDLSILNKSKFLIYGRIEDEIKTEVATLMKELPKDKVILNETFIDENELAYYYNGCDCILLPYAKSFQFTSGVLTRATASKVPVIASDHGVIGYRVKTNKLGFTYKSGNYKSLSRKLDIMIRDKAIRIQISRYLNTNVNNGELEQFKRIFWNTINQITK